MHGENTKEGRIQKGNKFKDIYARKKATHLRLIPFDFDNADEYASSPKSQNRSKVCTFVIFCNVMQFSEMQ